MSSANDIRNYCIEHYINSARINNIKNIIIRAGNVHNEMNYKDRMPLICSTLGSLKFEKEANIKRISITGPSNGANTLFEYDILFS